MAGGRSWRLRQVSCGHSHCAVVTETGDVWAWGASRAYGHTEPTAVPNVPTMIKVLSGKAIVQADSSSGASVRRPGSLSWEDRWGSHMRSGVPGRPQVGDGTVDPPDPTAPT